jgi:hypothetical protein
VTDFVHACLSLDSSAGDKRNLQGLKTHLFTLSELTGRERPSDDQTL